MIMRLAQCITAALLALIATTAGAQPSAPGLSLLPAAETARATVVGRIDGVTRLDRTAYAATVRVERTLAGDTRPGAALRVAWEELAATRPPRFADGQRVLVVLDDLPSGSLWRQRFPAGASAVAARGDAWLVDPSAGDLDLLAAYLQLGAPATSAARASALAHIAVAATPALASAAVARLASMPGAGTALVGTATDQLLGTAADARKPLALRRDIIVLAGRVRLAGAAAQLDALARPGSALEAETLTALAQVRGGLPLDRVARLLDRHEAAVRAVGARFATGELIERQLPPLVRYDSAPEVRAAAATALAATRTAWGVDGAVPALADPDPRVRSAAAQALGALGAPAVGALEAVARMQAAEARGAITALSLAGPNGVATVRRLAAEHPDPHVRDFARLALGQGPPAH